MCLKIEDRKIYKADRDITCFKRFRMDEASGNLSSPFTHMSFELGKTYRRILFSAHSINLNFRMFRFRIPNSVRAVERGFHSYRTYEDGLVHSMYFEAPVKCQIPKGSRYILGEDGEIVSLKIKPLEIVKLPKQND